MIQKCVENVAQLVGKGYTFEVHPDKVTCTHRNVVVDEERIGASEWRATERLAERVLYMRNATVALLCHGFANNRDSICLTCHAKDPKCFNCPNRCCVIVVPDDMWEKCRDLITEMNLRDKGKRILSEKNMNNREQKEYDALTTYKCIMGE